jgi:hypothetical protein
MLLLDVNHPVASPDFPCEAWRGRSNARGVMANKRCAYTSSQPSHAGSIANPVLCPIQTRARPMRAAQTNMLRTRRLGGRM